MRKFFLAIVLLIGAVYFTPRLLVRFSLFLGRFSKQVEEISEEKNFLFPPILEPLPEATNSATLSISGFSQGAEKVEVLINDISKEKVLVGNDSTFYLDEVRLFEEKNRIKAIAFDNKGNKSSPSKELIVVYKKKGPTLKVEKPEDGAHFSSEEKTIDIQGTVELGSTLKINDRFVVVKNDGSFIFKAELNEGENVFQILASDSAGNETVLKRSVTYSQN